MRLRILLVVGLFAAVVVSGVAEAIPPPVDDPAGDVATPDIDITEFDAGVLPDGSQYVPTSLPFADGTPVTHVWARFRFASGGAPQVDRHFYTTSMFVTGGDVSDLHVSAGTSSFGLLQECLVAAGQPCPIADIVVSSFALDDGSCLIVASIPLALTGLRMRGRSGIIGPDNQVAEDDRAPEFDASDPADATAEPVDLAPRSPDDPPPVPTTTSATTTTQPPPTSSSINVAPTTTEQAAAPPSTTTQVDGEAAAAGADDASADEDGGGFPWWVLVLVALVVVAGLGGWWAFGRRRRCDELELLWRQAQESCERARAQVDQWRESVAATDRMIEDLEEQLDELRREYPPSGDDVDEQTFIELEGRPGSRLTQADIWARRHYVGEAWDAYRSDPNPTTARELEESWERVDSDQVRDELRERDELARAERKAIDEALEQARSQKEGEQQGLDMAQQSADRACDAADEAEKAYRDCLRGQPAPAESPGPKAAARPADTTPTPPRPPGEPSGAGVAPVEPEPAAGGAPGPCRDGDERWVEFDGPHPFHVLAPEAKLRLRITSPVQDRSARDITATVRKNLPVADAEPLVDLEHFADVTEEDITSAFEGIADALRQARGPLGMEWAIPGAVIEARCLRRQVCREGEWVWTDDRRCERDTTLTSTLDSQDTSGSGWPDVSGSYRIRAVVGDHGLTDAEVMAKIVHAFRVIQTARDRLIENQRMLDQYCDKCGDGSRG